MEEHGDDLEPVVHEGAENETQAFPDTGDELDDTLDDEEPVESGEIEDDLDLDTDKSEL